MNFPDGLFGERWILASSAALAIVWLWCLRTAPWGRLKDSRQLNVWLGTVVILTVIWSMSASVRPGLSLHLLGCTLCVLMFERQLAIVGLSVVLAVVTLSSAGSGAIGWEPYALNALSMAVLPAFIAWSILRFTERHLPSHFFVYVFVAAFFGAALTIVATGLSLMLLLGTTAPYTVASLFDEFLVSYVLLAFAEAWLTGAAITLMVVYFPHCVVTFDDRRYLWNK